MHLSSSLCSFLVHSDLTLRCPSLILRTSRYHVKSILFHMGHNVKSYNGKTKNTQFIFLMVYFFCMCWVGHKFALEPSFWGFCLFRGPINVPRFGCPPCPTHLCPWTHQSGLSIWANSLWHQLRDLLHLTFWWIKIRMMEVSYWRSVLLLQSFKFKHHFRADGGHWYWGSSSQEISNSEKPQLCLFSQGRKRTLLFVWVVSSCWMKCHQVHLSWDLEISPGLQGCREKAFIPAELLWGWGCENHAHFAPFLSP